MYKLKPLPYLYQDLEPFIDTHTIGIHYHKHAKNYLNKLNGLLEKNNFSFNYPLEELPKHIEDFKESDREDILFNAGGVLNHQIYFDSMSKNPELPKGLFLDKINKGWGSLDKFYDELKKLALSLKGSGYIFLVVDKEENLSLIPMHNQNTPYYYDLTPLFCIDLWEHAYYLNVQNNKDLYLDNFLKVANFRVANDYFKAQ